MHRIPSQDLTRITLQVLWIGILIAACFWIIRPFLLPLIWAIMIVVATWPFMLKVEVWLLGRRGLAVAAMTIIMLLVFIIPFSLAVLAILENTGSIVEWVKSFQTQTLPDLPDWLSGIPVVGQKLNDLWDNVKSGPGELSARLTPYARKLLSWFLYQAGSIGFLVLQFLLTVIIAAIFYANGEKASTNLKRFARRLGGNRGEEIAVLAGKTIRGVALGIVGTAMIQSFLGGLGLVVAGVPAAAVLTAVMFMLCIAQLGPALVLIPAVIWVFRSDSTTLGVIFLAWSIFVVTFDNFLRPILIKRGADLPLFLIFAGVIGGLVSFGIIGLFIGPMTLAVTYRLIEVWVGEVDTSTTQELANKD